jgi:hypothetical protein
MTVELTTEQLAQELDRRRQQDQQDQQDQAATIQTAQKDWSKALLNVHKAKDQQLEEEGHASMAAAEKALQDGDLAGAYFNYIGWHASRWARIHLRADAQSSVNRVPEYTGPAIPDLRIIDVQFPEWLNEQGGKLATGNGADRYEEILGAGIPTSYEEATAWLEADRGN